ncbi:MAG: class I SAM-dependent methyltransferase [Pseudomonadota bacterium]
MTEGFASDWLSLRAPADQRARAWPLVDSLAAHLRPRLAARPDKALAITDLGAGAGNNLAALAPRLADLGLTAQHWRLVDADASLLAEAAGRPRPPDTGVETIQGDLAGDLGTLIGPRPDLITASALIDLAGAAWIERLAALAFTRRAAVLIVLSYDGRQSWSPPHADDADVHAAFDSDQRGDKGLGPALGPHAHDYMVERLREAGFVVEDAASDWQLAAPRDSALIAELSRGTGGAVGDTLGPRASRWADARQNAEAAMVGHKDLVAWLPDIA